LTTFANLTKYSSKSKEYYGMLSVGGLASMSSQL
jgi:hypothetical protein